MSRQLCLVAIVSSIALSQHSNASGQYAAWSVSTKASSDWLYHGASETQMEPAIGISVERQGHSGLYAGVEAHIAPVEFSRERQRSATYYLGYNHAATARSRLSYSLKYRTFPGSTKEWDYAEYSAQWSHQTGWQLRFDYAPDYYAHNNRALALELDYRRPIQDHWYWKLGAGVLDLSRTDGHRYASAGLGYAIGAASIDLSYHWSSEDGHRRFRAAVDSPEFVLSAGFLLW